MQTNDYFSAGRFLMLCKQNIVMYKKTMIMAITGFAGILFILLLLFQSKNHFRDWSIGSCLNMFFFLFFVLGLIYTSLSFPAFRSKEKSISYLLLPASTLEKYVFEIVSRIILFMVIMPLLFWLIANLEGYFINRFVPFHPDYQFSFVQAYEELTSSRVINNFSGDPFLVKYGFIQLGLFVFIFSFGGASYFSKSPLLKTVFTFSILVLGYVLFGYLLYKGLNLKGYNSPDHKLLGMDTRTNPWIITSVAFTTFNLTFLTFSFFSLKEKEV
jgi:hypothetical protein